MVVLLSNYTLDTWWSIANRFDYVSTLLLWGFVFVVTKFEITLNIKYDSYWYRGTHKSKLTPNQGPSDGQRVPIFSVYRQAHAGAREKPVLAFLITFNLLLIGDTFTGELVQSDNSIIRCMLSLHRHVMAILFFVYWNGTERERDGHSHWLISLSVVVWVL